MNIILLGAGGFIGKNLTIKLAGNLQNRITLVDSKMDFFSELSTLNLKNVSFVESLFESETDFGKLLINQDVVYHLVSTTVPTTSNQYIAQEFNANVVVTAKMLDACVSCGVGKVVFISSGGTVYGKDNACPIKEDTATYPISSYGIQKVTIEKLLYLYNYLFGLDYRIIRLSNPYGPYQRPNGVLGAVTTFTYRALKDEEIIVYGDGSVVRDFIYIDDAIRGIINIAYGESKYHIFNLGCGYGTSINEVLKCIENVLKKKLNVTYKEGRSVDVPVNFLDISRYEEAYEKLHPIGLEEGIMRTVEFMRKAYLGQ